MSEHKIPSNKLEEVRFWIEDDRVVRPHYALEVEDHPDHTACDECGILVPASYCSATVIEWAGGKERPVTLCNRCRLYKEDPKIRDTSRRATCEDCKVLGCRYRGEFQRIDPSKALEYKPPRVTTNQIT